MRGCGPRADRVLDLLTALVDKSLVLLAGDRYRLLETIKAYGRERLARAGEAERVRDAFVDWFSRLAGTAEPYLRRAEQLEWLAVLEADHDNLHAAVRAAISSGSAKAAATLASNVGWYWWLRGHKVEGAELAAEIVSMPGEVPARDRALSLSLAALLAVDGVFDQHAGHRVVRRGRRGRQGRRSARPPDAAADHGAQGGDARLRAPDRRPCACT